MSPADRARGWSSSVRATSACPRLRASTGYDVVGFDRAVDKTKRLAAGDSYVEDISAAQLAAALASNRYHPTDDPDAMAGFDVAVIDVPTPLEEGVPNLTYVEDRRPPWPAT